MSSQISFEENIQLEGSFSDHNVNKKEENF